MHTRLFVLPGLVLAGSLAGAAEVRLTAPPSVRRVGDKVTVSFAVSAPTDVEVAVLDGKGRAVRHLAAGVIGGENAPPAPLGPGLEQTIEWDGRDDQGKPLDRGPLSVRVRARMKPTFDGFLLYHPDATPGVYALAVGPKGQVYAFYRDATANGNQGGLKIKVLDRNGRHVRMLVPFPSDIDPKRIEPLGAFRDADGRLVPRVHNWQTLSFYPDTKLSRHRSMPLASVPAVDGRGRVHWLVYGMRLASVGPDGGAHDIGRGDS